MILDARQLALDAELEADVCVVGADPIGIPIAQRLGRAGLSVILLDAGGVLIKGVSSMLNSIRKTFLGIAAALALVTAVTPTVSNAAIMHYFDNTFGGTLDASENLGLIDLNDGAFTFSGVTGASSGGLNFSVMSSSLVPAASGAMQILIQAAGSSTMNITNLSFGGINLVLQPVIGGFAAAFYATVPAQFVFKFTNANTADSIQISLAAVPVPAAGLLLLGALGGLAALRRRKAA